MADTKISALPETTNPNGSVMIPVVEGGVTKKASKTNILKLGSETQAWDSFLDQIAALTDPNADKILYWNNTTNQFEWLTVGSGLSISGGSITASGGGGGAPTTAQYLTLATDATLTAERVLAFNGSRFSVTDGGAGGNYDVDIANDGITYAKIQNVSATDKLLGRITAGAGDIEEITCTAAGRALIDDADAAAQRTTLGLGALAVKSSIATGDINGDAVTFAKLQNIATARLLGRSTASSGDVEEISIGSGLSLSDGVLSATGGGGGATAALDNLSSVAINTSLLSDADNTDDLGSSAKQWRDIYLGRYFYAGGVLAFSYSSFLTFGSGSANLDFTWNSVSIGYCMSLQASTAKFAIGAGPGGGAGQFQVNCQDASIPVIIAKAASSQSANVFQNRNSSNTPVSGFDKDGHLFDTFSTPSSSGDTGAQGTVKFDASYIYVCTTTNTWKRAALSAF